VVREKVETARALEALPEIAAVALEGRFSDEQLTHVVRLADEATDAEWAQRAPNVDPSELARLARKASTPTTEDSRAQHQARSLRMWWTNDQTMFHLHGQLPVVMGQHFEATIARLTEQMKPANGQTWDSFEHRAADALLQLCDPRGATNDDQPSLASLAVLQAAVPLTGPAEIAGIPIADSLLEQLRANASIEPVLVDDHGLPLAVGTRTPALSPKIRRAVLMRDARCRVPGCARRHGLEIHHLIPRSRGGTDDLTNLACVCPAHHRLLTPHGDLALTGNPNQPDGLHLVNAADLPPPHADPNAA
jgi:hypothetical protein